MVPDERANPTEAFHAPSVEAYLVEYDIGAVPVTAAVSIKTSMNVELARVSWTLGRLPGGVGPTADVVICVSADVVWPAEFNA
jgi:hypothetical protein